MDETLNKCAICGTLVTGRCGRTPRYYCARCWAAWRDAIIEQQPWLVALYRDEKNRRTRRNRRRERGIVFDSLDEMNLDRFRLS